MTSRDTIDAVLSYEEENSSPVDMIEFINELIDDLRMRIFHLQERERGDGE